MKGIEIICFLVFVGLTLLALDESHSAKAELQTVKASCPISQGK